MMTPEQRQRYARNLLIPGFGETGQERLAEARVCIVGAGGLGSPVALYLASAGVGTLGIVDADRVELSNLQRQVLYRTADVGARKVRAAGDAVTALNPDVAVELHETRLTDDNAEEILCSYDAVVEATDDFDAKFTVNDACLEIRKPFVTAGILALSGQCLFVVPGQSPCLRCVMPEPPEGVPGTSEQGVLGAVPGILGSLEALEVVRWLTNLWRPAEDGSGRLHSVDGDSMRLHTMRVPRRKGCRCAARWSI